MRGLSILFVSVILFSCSGNKRTQEPTGSFPYESDDVSFKSYQTDITLAGTLTTPINDSLKTAVVLIAGSGPSDRDNSNQFGHRMFLVLSDYLTRRGITVLRYDERGVGQSEGNYREATYIDMESDAAGGVQYLREKGFQRIGIIGHSEGGGIAMHVSLNIKTDFLVLLAPANANAHDIMLYQTNQRLVSMLVDEAIRKQIVDNVDSMLTILETESDLAIAKTKMENFIDQKEKEITPAYREVSQRLGDPHRLIEGWLDPKFIYALHHDPLETLRTVRTPVLVLYGDQDGTVDGITLLPAMKSALDSTEHEIKIFPGLGHLFMNSQGVPVEKLHEVEETLAPEVLETMGDWILQKRVN